MPQLDKLAYVSQVIWLVVIFISLYFILLRKSLPVLFKVLKFRKMRIISIRESIGQVEREAFLVGHTNSTVLKKLGLNIIRVGGVCYKVVSNNLESLMVKARSYFGQERTIFINSNLSEEELGSNLSISKSLDENLFLGDSKVLLKKKIL